VSASGFHSCQSNLYREDYIKLGIPNNASKEGIKAAYFQRATQFHLDAIL